MNGALVVATVLMQSGAPVGGAAPPTAQVASVDWIERTQRASHAVEALGDELGLPGLVVVLVTSQGVERCTSVSAVEGAQVRLGESDPLLLGTFGTALTAVLAATLVDAGTVRWDDRVQTLLPEFTLAAAEAAEACTVRDLLLSRTGLMRSPMTWLGNPPTGSIVGALGRALPTAPFRSGVQRDATGFVPLGLALVNAAAATQRPVTESVATPERFEGLLRERVLAPLGMSATMVWRGEEAASGQPRALPQAGATRRSDGSLRLVPARRLDQAAPAVGLVSTAGDLTRFLKLLIGRGRADGLRVVSTERMEELWRGELPALGSASPEIAGGSGMGFQTFERHRRRVIRHDGGVEGLHIGVGVVPEEAVGYLVIALAAPEGFGRMVDARVLGALFGPDFSQQSQPSAAEADEVLAALAGRYRSSLLGVEIEIRRVGRRLALVVGEDGVFELAPADGEGRRAVVDVPEVAVVGPAEGDGPVRRIVLEQSGVGIECWRVDALPLPGSPDPRLRLLTGRYLVPASGAEACVVVNASGRLALELPASVPGGAGRRTRIEMTPEGGPSGAEDRWTLVSIPGGSATFHRDAGGGVRRVVVAGVAGLDELPRLGELSHEAAGFLPDPQEFLRRHRQANRLGQSEALAEPRPAPDVWSVQGDISLPQQGVAGRYRLRCERGIGTPGADLEFELDLGEFGGGRVRCAREDSAGGGATIDTFFDGPRMLLPEEADRWRLVLLPQSPAAWLPDEHFTFAGIAGPSEAPGARYVLRTPGGASAVLIVDMATLRPRRLETELSWGAAGSGPIIVFYDGWEHPEGRRDEPGGEDAAGRVAARLTWDTPVLGRIELHATPAP